MSYQKPLPLVTEEDKPFWEAARRHELVLPQCLDCGNTWFPPYRSCPKCWSFNREFVVASGKGRVWGFVEMMYPFFESFENDLPYNVVLVELEEGPRVFSNIVDIDMSEIAIGMSVEVVFDDVTGDVSIPKFKAVDS
jgi:uncharacterized OB-fold protein